VEEEEDVKLQAKLGLLVAAALAGAGCSFAPHDTPPHTRCDAGCGTSAPHAAPCAADEYHYVDQACGNVPDGGGPPCQTVGDGLCYQRCATTADCSIGFGCEQLGLFDHNDTCCSATVNVCASTAPHAAPCLDGEFEYLDQVCTGQGPTWCTERGDGLCYQTCTTTADCSRGYDCVQLGLYERSDTCCSFTVNVCRRCQSSNCLWHL